MPMPVLTPSALQRRANHPRVAERPADLHLQPAAEAAQASSLLSHSRSDALPLGWCSLGLCCFWAPRALLVTRLTLAADA